MKVCILVFFCCVASCQGLTWYRQRGLEPRESFFKCKTLLPRYAWGGNNKLSGYGRNVSFGFYGQQLFCAGPVSPLGPWNGQAVFLDFNAPCDANGVQLLNAQTSGAAIILRGTNFMDDYEALVWRSDSSVYLNNPSVIPEVYCSNQGAYSLYYSGQALQETTLFPFFQSFIGNAPNMTLQIDHPSQNDFWLNWNTVGSSTQMTYVSCLVVCIVVCIIAATKLTQFLHMAGRIRFDFPMITLTLAFCGGVFGIMLAEWGTFCWRAEVMFPIYDFFAPFVIGFAVTVVILMGLYFGEIASITSAQGVVGLSIYKWPAILIIAVCWIMILVTGGITAAGNASEILGQPTGFAVMGIIIATTGIALLISLWGGFFLLRASQGKGDVIRVVLITIASAVLLMGFATAWAVTTYDLKLIDYTVSQVTYLNMLAFFSVFVPAICLILIMMNFRVSVAKEIEISKSGTSSTSSGSSSSSSSSSSSNNSDPVIEL